MRILNNQISVTLLLSIFCFLSVGACPPVRAQTTAPAIQSGSFVAQAVAEQLDYGAGGWPYGGS